MVDIRTEQQKEDYLKKLDEKFPNIKVFPKEDLNIERMKVRCLKMMLNDPDLYPTIRHIEKDLCLSQRSIFRLLKKYKIPTTKGRVLN